MEDSNGTMIIISVIVLIINLVIVQFSILFGSIFFAFAGLWALLFLGKTFIEFFSK